MFAVSPVVCHHQRGDHDACYLSQGRRSPALKGEPNLAETGLNKGPSFACHLAVGGLEDRHGDEELRHPSSALRAPGGTPSRHKGIARGSDVFATRGAATASITAGMLHMAGVTFPIWSCCFNGPVKKAALPMPTMNALSTAVERPADRLP